MNLQTAAAAFLFFLLLQVFFIQINVMISQIASKGNTEWFVPLHYYKIRMSKYSFVACSLRFCSEMEEKSFPK